MGCWQGAARRKRRKEQEQKTRVFGSAASGSYGIMNVIPRWKFAALSWQYWNQRASKCNAISMIHIIIDNKRICSVRDVFYKGALHCTLK